MARLVCIGELLIDFCAVEADVGLAGARTFIKAPGGAPANVSVGAVRLGLASAFIGAVGDDPFGAYLSGTLAEAGVDVAGLVHVADVRTTLAFIASRSDGRKDITFYRNPGADMCLAPEHVEPERIASADAVHYGSISRMDAGPREATDKARRLAGEGGKLVSYDPNWRPSLWAGRDDARQRLLEGFEGAVVAKVSDEEWQFVTGTSDLADGAATLFDRGVELIVRSEGHRGASYLTPTAAGHVWPFPVECIEPTGAGDAQMASLIADLLGPWSQGVRPRQLAGRELERIVRRANAAGALACTRVGAIPSLPRREEVDALVEDEN